MTTDTIKTPKWIIIYSLMDNGKVILDEVYKNFDNFKHDISKSLNAGQKRDVLKLVEENESQKKEELILDEGNLYDTE